MKLHVSNLSEDTVDADLRLAFESYGKVESSRVVMDKISNLSKGFGFVEMGAESEAQAAITGMAGKDLKGNPLTVTMARNQTTVQPVKIAN